jgi:hypothetical protein
VAAIERTIETLAREAFPLLNRFALSGDEMRALSRQGFVRSERRGRKTVYRLSYRFHGRRCARYVCPPDAPALEAELELLQRGVRSRRRLNRLAALARQALRRHRTTLAPVLAARGYAFHGNQVRRRRRHRSDLDLLIVS